MLLKYKAVVFEFIATFLLVLIGTGSIVLNDVYSGCVTHLGISMAFGIAVTILILVFGKHSGAHLNPAVTISFFLFHSIGFLKAFLYIIAQISGAILASFFLSLIFPTTSTLGETIPSVPISQAFLIEAVCTFIIMLSIILSLKNKFFTKLIPFSIGGIIFLEAFFAGPLTGASMNPARSMGPALISLNTNGMWIYVIAPTVGAILAVIIIQFVNPKKN